jgi:signal transduction histidine kinase
MFQKLRLQLTGLCAAIMICIFILFTGLYLFLSEKTLLENHELAFRHTMDSFSMGLSQQTTILYPYLLGLEQSYDCLIYLWDKDVPLGFNGLEQHRETADLAKQLYGQWETEQRLSLRIETADQKGETFDVGMMTISLRPGIQKDMLTTRQEGSFFLLVLSSRDGLEQQIYAQRLWFLGLSFGGLLLLTLAAWWVTGFFLRPIRQNQQRQLRFVADASHELRTPLAVISSCISVCPPHYQETIQKECARMGRLIEDMLTLTALHRPEESELLLSKVCIEEPDTMLLTLYEEMEPLARQKGLSFHCDLPEDMLPTLYADPAKLRQLLLILLQNAITYTPQGGTIRLSLANPPKNISFTVADTGIGISDEEKELIFGRFYRGETSRTQKDHFGLGLCIAEEITAAHKGTIKVTDTPGGGATFTVILPLIS